MTAAKSTNPKTIVIPYVFFYACICVCVLALGVFVTAYGFIGDYYKLQYYPVMRIFPIGIGVGIVGQSLNMWLDQPKWVKR